MPQSPLLLYIHIPYCIHKCHYCDFNSHVRTQPDWLAYQQALITELTHWSQQQQYQNRKLHSIFFGGGTPSLAPASLIAKVLEHAQNLFGFEDNIEISLEANPGTVDMQAFQGFYQAGINRLSMGVQSLEHRELQWLERIHGSDDVYQAFDAARNAGFNNINLDFMYGLPHQTLKQWQQTLASALQLNPEHLSCYQLTVEPHTKLATRHASSPYKLPNDEASLAFFQETRCKLASAGYQAYEISNFAKANHYCRHNDGYWLYHDYIGIGAGASGKWDMQDGGTHRYSNIRTPEKYTAQAIQTGSAINSDESLNLQQAAAEAVWVGLRAAAMAMSSLSSTPRCPIISFSCLGRRAVSTGSSPDRFCPLISRSRAIPGHAFNLTRSVAPCGTGFEPV
ncbi:MAG: radical SAM family heme chaperone HemW [Mariprofundaceae bacterium]|nr:radical SAM family heme chaperone HemW [Mariprofundaceae bacterium]